MMKTSLVWTMMLLMILLSGCRAIGSEMESHPGNTISPDDKLQQISEKPMIPEKLSLNQNGIPVLQVYQVDEEETNEMDIESYLEGVLAGEMKNDWPIEALKAQAILARTFVLKFCTEKESKYKGADISTDIEEAQAYDETGINERIIQAVKETQGMVLSYQGELPYAWFHAHSGGTTARAKEGLNYNNEEPGYTKVTNGNESDKAPEDAKSWTANFSKDAIIKAANEVGENQVKSLESIEMGERGESGRLLTLLINGKSLPAPEFRIAIGSTAMRSTLITHLVVENNSVVMKGRGYGHGVGMPQWGAYAMAEVEKTHRRL